MDCCGHFVEFVEGVPVAGGGFEGEGFFKEIVGEFGVAVAAGAVEVDFLAQELEFVGVGGGEGVELFFIVFGDAVGEKGDVEAGEVDSFFGGVGILGDGIFNFSGGAEDDTDREAGFSGKFLFHSGSPFFGGESARKITLPLWM